jgi:hypothetical protein
LLEAVKDVEDGRNPRGANDAYQGIRAIEKVFARELPWRDVLLPEMYPGSPTKAPAPAAS